MYKNILIVAVDATTKFTDWEDRSTCVLFGDGAGAALIEAQEEETEYCGLIASAQGSDGVKGMVLKCRERALKNPYIQEEFEDGENLYVQMDGQAVYRFATRQVPDCINVALERAQLTVDDIDLFVLHQANVRIIEAVARGVDFFDCVMPARNARHARLFTWEGAINLKNAKYITDERPIDPQCDCPVCRRYTRAYIRHLFVAEEMLAMRLSVMHNLYFYNKLMEKIRQALDEGRFEAFRSEYSVKLANKL